MKHVTVNADQAVVTDQIISGKTTDAGTAALLASGTEKPMENLKPLHKGGCVGQSEGSQTK